MTLPKFVHGLAVDCDPRLAGESDREWSTRIDAERVTLELRTKQSNTPSDAILDSPLFGGPRQFNLFD